MREAFYLYEEEPWRTSCEGRKGKGNMVRPRSLTKVNATPSS